MTSANDVEPPEPIPLAEQGEAGPASQAGRSPVLDAAQLAVLRSYGNEHAISAGDVLFAEGDATYDLIVVLEGEVQIVANAAKTIDQAADLDRGGVRSPKQEGQFMIFGAHMIIYSKDATADRLFFRDILGFPSVDAGQGWLIFALPPAELAVHPAEEDDGHEIYVMCDDLKTEISALEAKGIRCSDVQEARWGLITKLRLPGGGSVGLYQPKHPTALALTSN